MLKAGISNITFLNVKNVDNKYNIFYENARLGSYLNLNILLKIDRGGYEMYCLQVNIITGTLRYVQAPSFPIQKYSGQFSLNM